MSFGFLPYQSRWINDQSRLKIIEKSRQIGITYADAFDSVRKAAGKTSGNHVWVSSRDELTARLYMEHCKRWARILHEAAEDLGQIVIDPDKDIKAHALRFASGWTIHCLSSNPDALVASGSNSPRQTSAPSQDSRLRTLDLHFSLPPSVIAAAPNFTANSASAAWAATGASGVVTSNVRPSPTGIWRVLNRRLNSAFARFRSSIVTARDSSTLYRYLAIINAERSRAQQGLYSSGKAFLQAHSVLQNCDSVRILGSSPTYVLSRCRNDHAGV